MNDIVTAAVAEPAAAASAAPHHVFLIDGSGFIFRAYFARARDPKAERFQRKSDGMPTEVVMIFSNMLDKYLRETDADHIAVIFDASGRSFRNEMYSEYKANRREIPDDLAPQLEHVRRAAEAFGVCQIEMENFEADDLIATYARHAVETGAKARLSKALVKLDYNVPLPCPLSDLRVAPYDPEKLFPFLDEMELRALKSRIEKRLAITAPAAPVGPTEPVIPEIPSFSMPRTYAVVDTMEGLDHWIEAAEQAGHVALWPAPSLVSGTRPEFCGLALAVSPGLAAYVPLGHRSTELFDGAAGLSREDAVARLKPLLEHPGVLKIVHDAKGAAHLLRRYAIALFPYDCTMLMSYVLDGGQFDHTIEEVARRALEHELVPQKEILRTGKNLICFAELTSAAARDFAAARADAALRLHMLLKARLLREHMNAFYETIERPLVPAVAAMEDAGIKVDRAALAELSQDFAPRIADLEQTIWRDVGHDFNIGSPKQLGDVLFEKLGLPGGKKGKTGAYGTDASILEQLSPLHPVPARVREWRQLTKLKSTYADALDENIDSTTGRVHTSFALAATATGRFSSSEPNIQNIPIRTEEGRKIRRAFVPAPGHLLP